MRHQAQSKLASCAGQDFSSRWFTDPTNISTIRTTQIIPAELNAYLFQMENNIARFAEVKDCICNCDSALPSRHCGAASQILLQLHICLTNVRPTLGPTFAAAGRAVCDLLY